MGVCGVAGRFRMIQLQHHQAGGSLRLGEVCSLLRETIEMTATTEIERRTLLRAITAASGAAVTSAILSTPTAAQPAAGTKAAGSGQFETAEIKVGDNSI